MQLRLASLFVSSHENIASLTRSSLCFPTPEQRGALSSDPHAGCQVGRLKNTISVRDVHALMAGNEAL